MKTTRILASLLFVSISVFVIISSENVSGKAPTNNAMLEVIPTIPLPDCNADCINPDGPYNVSIGSQTANWGNTSNPHSKTVSYAVYNTATSFVVNVTFVRSGGNASDLISVTALGSTQSVETLASGATATFTFPLPAGWEKCDNILFSIRQEGQSAPLTLSGSYNLYGICTNKGCETSFTGETVTCDNSIREAKYTFTSKEAISYFKIQGGLTNFTGTAIVSVEGGNITANEQWTPGSSTNRVIKVEGNAEACETITITIKWTSSNSNGIITGGWSVKDNNGVEIAPAVAGLTCN